jgi:hypothetical protein
MTLATTRRRRVEGKWSRGKIRKDEGLAAKKYSVEEVGCVQGKISSPAHPGRITSVTGTVPSRVTTSPNDP